MKVLTKQEVIEKLKSNYGYIHKITYIILGFMGLVWLFGGAVFMPYLMMRENKFVYIFVAIISISLGYFVLNSLIKSIKKVKSDLQKIQTEHFYLTINEIVDIKKDFDEGGSWFNLKFDNGSEVSETRKVCSQIGDKFYFVYLEGEKMPLYDCYKKTEYILSADLQDKLIGFKE